MCSIVPNAVDFIEAFNGQDIKNLWPSFWDFAKAQSNQFH